MKTKVVLFDLDGTLLPMDQSIFTKTYFGLLAKKLEPFGYQQNSLIEAVWAGTIAMFKNNGQKTNEEVFWDTFANIFGEHSRKDFPNFEDFYINDFDKVQISSGFNPLSNTVIKKMKEKNLRVALATNPIFPAIATHKRIKWAGLDKEDFELITTYENSNYCKPNPKYYLEIIKKLNVSPEECLMVGNDVAEDMVAQELGMKVFLLTDCIINKDNKDISQYPNGDFESFLKYIETIE